MAWYSSFHQALNHLVMLIYCTNLYWIDSKIFAYSWTMSLRKTLSGIIKVSIFPNVLISSEVKFSSFLLFLIIVQHLSWINSSTIKMLTVKRVWLDRYWSSEIMMWLSNSMEFGWRKNRSMTEFVSLVLSE